ncbi:hypothetical protein [Sphingobacterium sp. HMA12]|nr:hypothetical protein [Sphingobacterium sp. HMA12]
MSRLSLTATRECGKPAPVPVAYWAGTATGGWLQKLHLCQAGVLSLHQL